MNPIRAERLPWRDIDNHAVIINVTNGKVHELNTTGTLLWINADGNLSKEQLAEILCQNFETDMDEAIKDVDEFFADLNEDGLINWK